MTKQNNDYAEQYKNPKWQKLRLKILDRDGWACQKCGDDESQLQVHHRRYIYGKKVWDYSMEELITLCNECHEEEKDCMKIHMELFIGILKTKLFSSHVNDLVCSLGWLLYQDLHHPDILISALGWVINHKFDENIMKPYMDHLTIEGNKRRVLCEQET